jgi:DNA-directed RNA polymerase subunit RPC12/RpoP
LHGKFEPKGIECPDCHKKEYVAYKRVPKGEELVYVYYKCLNCGSKDVEPID